MTADEHYRTNRLWWDERAGKHLGTPMYREHLEKLRSGGVALKDIEREEVGDVAGRRLLHLQCHVGTDTLSWVRLGARVTGVDFSEEALRQARRLSDELGLPADFVHGNACELEGRFDEDFDVVVTSYGALVWLHDLRGWARGIASALAPGGLFHVVDAHPMYMALDDRGDAPPLRLRYPYFEGGEPLRFEDGGSYADPDLPTEHDATVEWQHSISEIVNAVLEAGLRVERLGEHRAVPWQALPCCERGEDGLWRLPEELREACPLLFSLAARKPPVG